MECLGKALYLMRTAWLLDRQPHRHTTDDPPTPPLKATPNPTMTETACNAGARMTDRWGVTDRSQPPGRPATPQATAVGVSEGLGAGRLADSGRAARGPLLVREGLIHGQQPRDQGLHRPRRPTACRIGNIEGVGVGGLGASAAPPPPPHSRSPQPPPRPGIPTLTVGLRGMANVIVEVRTLQSAKHSGQYGGAAPDALLALMRGLASLHDDVGNVAVAGLLRTEWTGGGPDEAEFRQLAEALDDAPLIGTGTLGSRVWSGPAITVIGIDVPSVAGALNAVSPYARAKLNVRVHPEQDPVEAQAAVAEHLRNAMPFGIALTVHEEATGSGFAARTSSPAYTAASEAWSQAWGAETLLAGAGGSIPLVASLAEAAPNADILLVGATDGYSNIHGPNERVLIDEFAKTTLAEADLLGRLAELTSRQGS